MNTTNQAVLEPRFVGDITGFFHIPAYQRGYRWGKEEVERLLDDIWASDGKPYYLQPVVVKSMPDGRWELIDGQQRLTTLYLIFQYMHDKGLKSTGAGYTLEYETRPESQEFLSSLDGERREANIDFHHIFGAYQSIQTWFDAHGHRTQLAADKFYIYLFDSIKIIWYEAPANLDSIALFTRLNIGRIPLTDAELVKALVLARSRQRPGYSDKSEQIAAQWDSFERDLRLPEVWSFVTGKHEDEATHIGLLLDTLADQMGGKPDTRHRPRYYTFETLRPKIEQNPQAFWDDVVKLHSLIIGWYEDRDIFHKIGYLVALDDSFEDLVQATAGLTRRELHRHLDERIRLRLSLSADDVRDLNYEKTGAKCLEVLLLMNVETVRSRQETSERYSFRSLARDSWSLEHIHARNAKEMKRDVKLWAEWLQLHRDALSDIHEIRSGPAFQLLREIDDILASIADERIHGVSARFDAIKPKVEAALSDAADNAGESVHSISNLALLANGDNSALSNSTFEVKRRAVLQRDKNGSYIPACTRNIFLKYYTDSDAQQIHYWGAVDRDAYSKAMISAIRPYLLPDESQL